jgi:glycosyltransferase involved in cell wall biosynthesis
MPRLMILSHGHPDLSHGGAEMAAFAIHSLIKQGKMPGWDSIFVARAERQHIGHDGDFGAFRRNPDEILVAPPGVEPFFFHSYDPNRLFGMLDELVDRFRPDLVHAHHFSFWGTDIFEYFKARGIPLVITLHEYISICHRFGQMLKVNGRLCHRSSPVECNGCFPDISSGFFFLRDELFLKSLGMASAVISPSQFLAQRVETWSGGAIPVQVIENPRDVSLYEKPQNCAPRDSISPVSFQIGYFGQINHFKGTEVLLDAAAILKSKDVSFRIRLFGANLNIQEPAFRERIEAKLEALGDCVEFFGPYRNEAVIRLMSGCDAIVIPSIWWENSPVVIQEALQAGVPVFGSRLGGIEEKLKDYHSAEFFEPGSSRDLAERLQFFFNRLAQSSQKQSPTPNTDCTPSLARLKCLYDSCLSLSEGSALIVSTQLDDQPSRRGKSRRATLRK